MDLFVHICTTRVKLGLYMRLTAFVDAIGAETKKNLVSNRYHSVGDMVCGMGKLGLAARQRRTPVRTPCLIELTFKIIKIIS